MHFSINTDSPSLLKPNSDGVLKVNLIQAPGEGNVLGVRSGFEGAQGPFRPSALQVKRCRKILTRTKPGVLNVVSFHPGISGCLSDLRDLSNTRTIVTMGGIDDEKYNYTYIAESGVLKKQAKLSLSSEDQEAGVKSGSELNIFLPTNNSTAVRWAVLNCHDYSHVDLLLPLLDAHIEFIVVVSYNNATRLYWEYAVADIHRLFCYVVIVNAAELGGSGVFAPIRRIGLEANAQISAAGQIFGARGACDFGATINLDIKELRRLRDTFRADGFSASYIARREIGQNTAVVPSEHFMSTVDRGAGPPPVFNFKKIKTIWSSKSLRLAVAQLDSMPIPAYIDTCYRIRHHRDCSLFQASLDSRLADLENRCKLAGPAESGAYLDFLIFPEVFIPRPYAKKQLQEFSNRLGATIICGLDYPDGGEAENANECAIIRPSVSPLLYRKITRSQYDALRDTSGARMRLSRGDTLYRFVNDDGDGFGVLICYDFSHFDILSKINLSGRDRPLDVMFVVAHNPFGNLYRSCCLADAHRFYQYVVMCNVARYGGSGVFAPIRASGARQTILEIGKGTDAVALTELDLAALHTARQTRDRDLHEGAFMRRPGIFNAVLE